MLIKPVKIISAILSLLVWVAMVACAWANHVSPLRSSVAPLMYMVFPCMLLLGLVCLMLALLWNSRLAFAGVIFQLCCLPQTLDFCPLHFNRQTVDTSVNTDNFSVLTYNAYYFNSYRGTEYDSLACVNTVLAILEADPDIVVMQESQPYDPFEMGRQRIDAPLAAQIRSLYPYRAFTHESMGIISKYPFEIVPLPNYNPTAEQSFILQHVVVEVGDSAVHVLNCHLQSLHFLPDELRLFSQPEMIEKSDRKMLSKAALAFRKRARQAEMVRSIVDSIGDVNVVVCGDFNDVPDCWAMRTIAGNSLNDVYAASGLGPAITYRKHHLYFRIDQMLASRRLKPLGSKVVMMGESDHYPLFSLFTFRQ